MEEPFLCPNCNGSSMRVRNGFSSCPVCGYQIQNYPKEDDDGEKTKKD